MMLFEISLMQLFLSNYACQQFEVSMETDHAQKGKEILNKMTKDAKLAHTPCWKNALMGIEKTCREMNDIEQSLLAVQFANCHFEKSGLETYNCQIDNFKECTNKMSQNFIAYQAYTEFFTHVADICYYLQSDIWREKTEKTVTKLTQASEESLSVLAKSVVQQKEVLSAQEHSLKNQEAILRNEQLLRETILTSAESARDVFEEVKEHAQQQKTMFSETFDHIFQSVEKLANLQTMLLGEFIGLQSLAFYLVSVFVCYLFSSTPRTSAARLPLFGCLTLLIIFERMYVKWAVRNENEDFTTEYLHEKIWSLRKVFLVFGMMVLAVCMFRYKDYNKIQQAMLQDIQVQIIELRKMQETHVSKYEGNSTGKGCSDSVDSTIVSNTQYIEEATRQLEMSLQALTSTPQKEVNAGFIFPQLVTAQVNDVQLKNDAGNGETSEFQRRKKNTAQRNAYGELNESRYNLRSRRSSASFNSTLSNSQVVKNNQKTAQVKGNAKNGGQKKRAYFSSDEESV